MSKPFRLNIELFVNQWRRSKLKSDSFTGQIFFTNAKGGLVLVTKCNKGGSLITNVRGWCRDPVLDQKLWNLIILNLSDILDYYWNTFYRQITIINVTTIHYFNGKLAGINTSSNNAFPYIYHEAAWLFRSRIIKLYLFSVSTNERRAFGQSDQ